MINAYLFINLSTENHDENLLDSLAGISEVVEAFRVYGTYDVIIRVQVEDTNDLKRVTLNSVRQLGFVHSTMTLISLSHFEKEVIY